MDFYELECDYMKHRNKLHNQPVTEIGEVTCLLNFLHERGLLTQGWQDISTAPKDGTCILAVYIATENNKTFKDHTDVFAVWWDGDEINAWCMTGSFEPLESEMWKLTHYMPLPTPPKE